MDKGTGLSGLFKIRKGEMEEEEIIKVGGGVEEESEELEGKMESDTVIFHCIHV